MTSAAVSYFNMFSISASNKQLLYPEDRGTVCSHQGCSLVPSPDRRREVSSHHVLRKPLPGRVGRQSFPLVPADRKAFPPFPAQPSYFSVKATNVRLGEETEEPESCTEGEW